METKEEEYFTNKLEDKKLRAKSLKVVCENPHDAATLQIILKQTGLSEAQRTWIEKLIGRNGKQFVFTGETQKNSKKVKQNG